jgi:serine protease Do
MSGGALAMLLVCCMLVSILAGAGINYVFDHGNGVIGATDTTTDTSSTDTTAESTQDTVTENPPETTTGETAPPISIGGGDVIGNTEFPEYEVYATVATQCVKSVVIIRVTESVLSYGQEYTTSGAGSGVIFDPNGYIVTNYHVVGANTKTISVELYDGSVYEGKYIYGDEFVDLAVIKIEKTDCVAARIGDSSRMALGQMVVAIGNPLGYGLTVTPGVVSALQRSVTVENTTMTLMQTSAAINSGNSGGGLFNLSGELIGIVNAKVGGTSVEGMGFAIPSTTVVKSLNDLKDYGYITGKARLGVTVQTKQYQTWPYMQTYYYTQVVEISPNGSAAKSGLQVGDILYKFNGTEITSFEVLSQQLTKYKVGDTVTLTVRRPTVELTSNNLSEYLNTSEELELQITFVEFNPNA